MPHTKYTKDIYTKHVYTGRTMRDAFVYMN